MLSLRRYIENIYIYKYLSHNFFNNYINNVKNLDRLNSK